MALWTTIGILAPILLIFARKKHASSGEVGARCLVAFFIVWASLAFGSEHYARERGQILIARGALEESVALDGVMLGAYVMGWIPAFLYVVTLAGLHRMGGFLRRKGLPGFPISFTVLAIILGAFFTWRSRANATIAPKILRDTADTINEITLYSVQAPVRVNDMEPFTRAGHATFPTRIFVMAVRSARYSGPDARPTEPAWVADFKFFGDRERRARLGETFFAFEGLDGFFTVSGAEGQEYRRQVLFAKEAAFAEAESNATHLDVH